jgi:hypothetical protein
MPKYWLSPVPTKCDLCHGPVAGRFYDAKTALGPWGIVCPHCFKASGHSLGTGRGQEYTLQNDGKWLKTGG